MRFSRLSISLMVFGFALPCPALAEKPSNSITVNELTISEVHNTPVQKVTIDLEDLITIALKNNQIIEVVRQKQVQSQGQLTQAWSGYLPHLSVEGRYYYAERKDSSLQSRSDSVATNDENGDVVQRGANLSQLIYDFGKTTGAIDAGKLSLEAAKASLQRQVQDIIFQVKAAYNNVLEKQRLIDVADESVKGFEQHLGRANLYLKAGVRTKIDVINAEVELSNANMSLLKAQYSLKTARVALEQVLGTKPNQGEYILDSDEVQLDNILASMPPVPDTLDNLIKKAMDQRPDIIQLKKLTEAAKANLKRVTGDYWPSIKADAKYNDYNTKLSSYEDNWEIGLTANWELFSGLHTKGAAVEAQGRLLESKALLQDLQLAIVKDVTESYLRADENRESVKIALQTLELAKKNIILAEKRYQSGANDVIEFNDAQISLTRAKGELVITYFGYLTAFAGIEHAIGKIPGQ